VILTPLYISDFNVKKATKIFLFVLLFALLWVPFIQEQAKLIAEVQLKGAFVSPVMPEFSMDSLNELKFQKQFEDYLNSNFGFRGLLVKVRNSIDYLLFNEVHFSDYIMGKNGYLFTKSYAKRTLGITYNGKVRNDSTLERINFLRMGLEKRGHHLICLIVPSKESVIPELLPSLYRGDFNRPTDYVDFAKGLKKYNIPHIDYYPYFRTLKNTSPYPIVTKTGVHWSMYGASLAHDTLASFIEKTIGKEIPKYRRTGVEWSDTARGEDEDYERSLNLLFRIGQFKYAYSKLEMIEATKDNYHPKMIFIGDSFFWQLKEQEIFKHMFSSDSWFWFYFASNSVPMGDGPWVDLKSLDIMQQLESADCVVLLGSIGTLDWFPFGVADYYYEHIGDPQIFAGLIKCISDNQAWVKQIRAKEGLTNASAENLINTEAKNIFRDKMPCYLRASNGKCICSGSTEDRLVLANRDVGSLWELFYMLKLTNNTVAVFSYKNKYLSVDLGSNAEVTSVNTNLGSWETFTIEDLAGGFIAIKAVNGKYLSLDEKTQKIYANGNAIGKNEKFKMESIK
jgi:hypothetical protein